MPQQPDAIPAHASACLILGDGHMFFGTGIGAKGITTGEICFNTAMTGYQEVLTDPSYAGQIITFTFPHIGNVGCNAEDIEAESVHCNGLVVREIPTVPSSFRSSESLQGWLEANNITGIAGVDTRALTRHIRKHGAQNVAIVHAKALDAGKITEAQEALTAAPSMKGRELAKSVSTKKSYEWNESLWTLSGDRRPASGDYHVVAIDYGAKHNILRNLAERGCGITVLPSTASADDILTHKPDGIFLSNGPGDPAATGQYALPVIRQLIDSGLPIFGICLGHQLLALALGARTEKMQQGHRGANHPVKDLQSGKVIITSQNHGFVVSKYDLPADLEITHISLFDGTIQGLRHKTKPIFCVQGHPEASPGPHDSAYLFDAFLESMQRKQEVQKAHA
ncbi:MAG: glutamine-hydrolyzing carbamoyl-phosphate synthase small subunit [Alphaproteobacteria bacterium]